MTWGGVFAACALPYAVPVTDVFGIVSAAVCRVDGWEPVDSAVTPGPRSWRQAGHHGPALVSVLAGLFPRVVVVGSAGVVSLHRKRYRRALDRIVADVFRHGGRGVGPEELDQQVGTAGANFAAWCATVRRLEEVVREMNLRTCRVCGGRCMPELRWCPQCEAEFSLEENHEFDLALVRLRKERQALTDRMRRLTGLQLQPLAVRR